NNYEYKNIYSYHQIPHFWDFDSNNLELLPCKQKCVSTFLDLISNKVIEEGKEYIIKGYHNLTFKLNFKEEKTKIITKIYTRLIDFTIDTDRHFDKLLILRNVITTYINDYSDFTHLNNQGEKIQ